MPPRNPTCGPVLAAHLGSSWGNQAVILGKMDRSRISDGLALILRGEALVDDSTIFVKMIFIDDFFETNQY